MKKPAPSVDTRPTANDLARAAGVSLATVDRVLNARPGVRGATVEKVKVVPVGIEYEPKLLDGTLWFSNFWFQCLAATPSAEGRAAITMINRHRFKKRKDVTKEDFQLPIHTCVGS